MKVANIVTAAAICAWLVVALFGHSLLSDLAGRGVRGHPSIQQINMGLVGPVAVVTALLAAAWLSNIMNRWPGVLALMSLVAIFAALPYVFAWGWGF